MMLHNARKDDLKIIAEETGKTVTSEIRIVDLKDILGSEAYRKNPEFVKNFVNSKVEAKRKQNERREKK